MPSIYRNSRQRQRVLDTVLHSGLHPTADWVYHRLRESDPTISLGTVYRNLDVLCRMGKLTRLGSGLGPEAFDRNINAHYHLVCQRCGKLEDVPIPYMEDKDQLLRELGFLIDGHRMFFDGLCLDCAHRDKGKVSETHE